jgi:hypothetical protein
MKCPIKNSPGELAQKQDRAGIREIAEGLHHRNPDVQSNCIKVLYEIGYLNPELVEAKKR